MGKIKRHGAFLILWQLKSALWSKYVLCEKWHEANYPVFQISGKSYSQTNRITHHKECLKLCCFICQQIQPWKKGNRMNSLKKTHNGRGGLYLAHYLQAKNSFVSCMSLETLWQNLTDCLWPNRAPHICGNLTGVHLSGLGLTSHYSQEKSSCVYL